MIASVNDVYLALLKSIGSGRMPPIAYDTAWAARLGEMAPGISEAALAWLCEHQLSDGSWGANVPVYYHDRAISTLAAMVALKKHGRRETDKKRVELGQAALTRILSGATTGLSADPNGATVGFEMIAPMLIAEAQNLGLVPSQGVRLFGRMEQWRQRKIAEASHKINRYVTLAFSAEMAGHDGLDLLDIDNLPEQNGSIGVSPAATAFYALYVRPGDSAALRYLSSFANGGFPDVAPFDVFEVAWTLWNLHLTIPSISLESCVREHLDFLRKAWRPGKGVGFASCYSVADGDDTGLVYDTLAQYGIAVDLKAVLAYELPGHFRCYDLEANPSISANVHILNALRTSGAPRSDPTVAKVLTFLMQTRNASGYWTDKWHLSPYYVTAHAIIACSGYAPEVISQAVDWVLASQRSDGSWGAYYSSAEETAYCIQALWTLNRTRAIPKEKLQKALSWLADHALPPYQPLWIGKGLYCPENVVKSAILSALAIS